MGTKIVCVTPPETPVTLSEYGPAAKLLPFTTRETVAGNEATEAGVMLQLLAPKVSAQFRVTTPVNPSCAAIETGPAVPVVPALTSGNAEGSERMKSGLATTFTKKRAVIAFEEPDVV